MSTIHSSAQTCSDSCLEASRCNKPTWCPLTPAERFFWCFPHKGLMGHVSDSSLAQLCPEFVIAQVSLKTSGISGLTPRSQHRTGCGAKLTSSRGECRNMLYCSSHALDSFPDRIWSLALVFLSQCLGQGYLESTNESEPTREARGTVNRPSVFALLVEESTGPTKTEMSTNKS